MVLVVVGLTALTAAVALAVTQRAPARLAVARGVVDGSFHPIAGRFVPDTTRLGDCHRGDARCFEQAFGNIAFQEGPRPALAVFDKRRAVAGTVSTDCHRIAHMIGSAALAYFHGNVAEAYAHGSASCASGYFHGILERAFVGVDSKAGLIRAARSLCRGAGVRRRGFLDYQCTHGLGHGLMIQTGYDLPTALAVCRSLQSRWDDVSCTGGVFMENGSTVYGMRSRWLRDNDPVFPCHSVSRRDQGSCYLRVTTQMLRTSHFDWRETAARCHAISAAWRRYCFRSYGRDAANWAAQKIRAVLHLCELARTGGGDCLYGAARSIADRDASAGRAAALCRSATASERPACFGGVGVVVGLLYANAAERQRACTSLTFAYRSSCTHAAAAEVAPDGRGAWG